MSSTAVAKRDAVTDVCVAINAADFKGKIGAALPAATKQEVDRFVRAATTAIQLNPDVVARGSKGSVLTSLMRCAQDGLLPDGKEAALVLFGTECRYMPMVGGFRKRAADHGFSLTAQIVHKNDKFTYELGLNAKLEHTPTPLDEDPGEFVGAYAIAKHATLGTFIDVMRKSEIEQVRSVSRAKGGDLWTKWFGEAARKTVARRLFKQLPLTADPRAASMISADDEMFDLSPGPLSDLPVVDPSDEEVEGEVFDGDEQGSLA